MSSSVAADVTVVVAPDAPAMVHCSGRAVPAALLDDTLRMSRWESIEGIAPRENAPARTKKPVVYRIYIYKYRTGRVVRYVLVTGRSWLEQLPGC